MKRSSSILSLVEKLERVAGRVDTRTPLAIAEEEIRDAIESGHEDCWIVSRWQSGDRSEDIFWWINTYRGGIVSLYESDRGLL